MGCDLTFLDWVTTHIPHESSRYIRPKIWKINSCRASGVGEKKVNLEVPVRLRGSFYSRIRQCGEWKKLELRMRNPQKPKSFSWQQDRNANSYPQ
jgi:hypothetical protein